MLKKFISLCLVVMMLSCILPTVSFSAATISTDAFDVNYIFDDCNEYSAAVWRTKSYNLTSETVATADSSGNKAYVLDNLAGNSTNLPNLQLQDSKGYSCSGDVIVEFDMLINSSAAEKNTGKIFEPFFGDSNTNVSAGAIINLRTNGQFRIYYKDASGTEKYKTLGTDNQFGVWNKMRFVLHTDTYTFSFWHNDTPVVTNVAYNTTNDLSSCKSAFIGFRVQLTSALKFKVAIDNIKVGKYLNFKKTGFTDGSDNTVYAAADGVNKYKTQVLNNSSVDAKTTVIMAAYDNVTNELKRVYTNEVTLEAGKVTDIVATLNEVDPSWKIKAFFWDSIDTINPLKKSFGDVYDELPATAQAVASTRTVDISSDGYVGIEPTYPDGKYKAVTVRCDDGYASDRDLIEIFDSAGIKGTFYVCEKNIGAKSTSITESELKTLYLDAGHEIANHTANHLKLNSVIDESVDSDAKYTFDPYIKNDIKQGKDYLEDVLDIKINGFTAPYSSLYDAAGLAYLTETGHTYAVRNQHNRALSDGTVFDLPDISNVYDIRATLRDMYIDPLGNDAINYADAYLALDEEEMSLFFLWGHSGDFNSYGDDVSDANKEKGYPMKGNSGVTYGWEFARTLYNKLGGKSDIWYATNGDIFHYLFAQNDAQITLGTNAHRVYNPSETITLYFDLGSEVIEVEPLETVIINIK
ncbi:MAG: polysaccharide deacetylase family protein [Clostridia bacterium]|nr:polysaccharide deacetylase family protein [Clostridia bacterium]